MASRPGTIRPLAESTRPSNQVTERSRAKRRQGVGASGEGPPPPGWRPGRGQKVPGREGYRWGAVPAAQPAETRQEGRRTRMMGPGGDKRPDPSLFLSPVSCQASRRPSSTGNRRARRPATLSTRVGLPVRNEDRRPGSSSGDSRGGAQHALGGRRGTLPRADRPGPSRPGRGQSPREPRRAYRGNARPSSASGLAGSLRNRPTPAPASGRTGGCCGTGRGRLSGGGKSRKRKCELAETHPPTPHPAPLLPATASWRL